jgi:membrane protease YdiL (CAAX protease family)
LGTRAIVVCALLFGISHLHISYLFALAALVPGLFWGWLFSRRPNLVGVWLSHVCVGTYVFFILGINL